MPVRHGIARLAGLIFLALAPPASAQAGAPGPATEWINGRWFNGRKFVQRTAYSSGGRFIGKPKSGVAARVDLKGGYVVPAFGDAHHHGIDRIEGLEAKIATFLRDGIFYVKNPNVIPDFLSPAMRERLNRPDSIDVAFANGGLTSAEGHPGPLHDRLAANGVFPGLTAGDMAGRAYFAVDTLAKLDAIWPTIAAGRPDFVKVFLNGSVQLKKAPAAGAAAAGVPGNVLRAVVRRAHAARLRVTAHVDTASDFVTAVQAGVDELAHMPLAKPGSGDLTPYRLTPRMAALAAGNGVTVVATAGTIPRLYSKGWSRADRESIAEVQRANMKILQAARVQLAIGSDGISGETPFVTARFEIGYMARHRLAENLSLLKMWSENTPKTIFPGRKIGRLLPGYEANFLVLKDDPVRDISAVERILIRVKSGQLLALPKPDPAPRLDDGTLDESTFASGPASTISDGKAPQ